MQQPNIVVLLLDAARVDHFSGYGYDRQTTPFIDKLISDGVRYDHTYANSIWSLPSYSSIFTGEYPTQHGAVDWSKRVNKNSLVEGLNERGYMTAAVSPHLVTGEFGLAQAFDELETVSVTSSDRLFRDDPVLDRMGVHGDSDGWSSEYEKYLVFLKTIAHHPSYKSFMNGGFKLWWKIKKHLGFWGDQGGKSVANRSSNIIKEASQPFFLFANFVETHDPYRPPRSIRSKFLPNDVTLKEARKAVEYSSVRATVGLEEMDQRRTEILKALYDAEIAYTDTLVEQIYESLEDRGVADSTAIVVLSDHGDFFGEHGLWGHQGGMYDPVSQVPLVINYPWQINESTNGPFELRGLEDHVLSLSEGQRSPMSSPGEALVEYYGLDTQHFFTPWIEYEEIDPDPWGNYQCGYTDGEYRLIWGAGGQTELYKLDDFNAKDEVTDKYPGVCNRMKERITEMVGHPNKNHARYRSDQTEPQAFHPNMDSDVKQRLSQLGYTE